MDDRHQIYADKLMLLVDDVIPESTGPRYSDSGESAEVAELRQHLDQCSTCQDELQALRRMTRMLQEALTVHPTVEDLVLWAESPTGSSRAQEIERHVAECAMCEAHVALLREEGSQPSTASAAETIPPALLAQLQSNGPADGTVISLRRAPRVGPWRAAGGIRGLALLAASLLVVVGWSVWNPIPNNETAPVPAQAPKLAVSLAPVGAVDRDVVLPGAGGAKRALAPAALATTDGVSHQEDFKDKLAERVGPPRGRRGENEAPPVPHSQYSRIVAMSQLKNSPAADQLDAAKTRRVSVAAAPAREAQPQPADKALKLAVVDRDLNVGGAPCGAAGGKRGAEPPAAQQDELNKVSEPPAPPPPVADTEVSHAVENVAPAAAPVEEKGSVAGGTATQQADAQSSLQALFPSRSVHVSVAQASEEPRFTVTMSGPVTPAEKSQIVHALVSRYGLRSDTQVAVVAR